MHKVHAKGASLFDSLIRWIELFLTVIREGVGERVSLEFLLPHTGQERTNILREVDAVALYHYRLKVAYESKVRKRFLRGTAPTNGSTTADEDDEATQALVDGVVRDLSFGDLVRGDAEDLAAEDSESEDESEMESGSETETDSDDVVAKAGHVVPPVPPLPPSQSSIPVPAQLKEPGSSSFDLPSSSRNIVTRARSFSLRSRKSTEFLKTQKSVMNEIPPVPPLPGPPVHPAPPALVPSLRRQKTTNDLKRSFSRKVAAAPHKPPKRKPASDIKAPDLKAIPGLLPLFVEMVSRTLAMY